MFRKIMSEMVRIFLHFPLKADQPQAENLAFIH